VLSKEGKAYSARKLSRFEKGMQVKLDVMRDRNHTTRLESKYYNESRCTRLQVWGN